MINSYESRLSYTMSGKTIKYTYSGARADRVPFMEAIKSLGAKSKDEMWRKKLKLRAQNPILIYIGQTGPTGDRKTKYVVLNSADFSKEQVEQIAHWLYEKQSKNLTREPVDEPIVEITVMNFYNLNAGPVLSTFMMDGEWYLEQHDITNEQLKKVVRDIDKFML